MLKCSINYVSDIMCNGFCKEFTGWCRAFTKTEVFLCVLQAIFLVVFITFLTFVILHLVVCSRNKQRFEGPNQIVPSVNDTQTTEGNISTYESDKEEPSQTESDFNSTQSTEGIITGKNEENESSTVSKTTVNVNKTDKKETTAQDVTEKSESVQTDSISTSKSTLDKKVKCTWNPSEKTKAFTHYYDKFAVENKGEQVTKKIDNIAVEKDMESELEDNELLEDSTDGKEIDDAREDFLLALVKIKPLQGITFGCTLTIVSEFWTLTAASCIEAIEEVDSLDSFVMMQGFKEENQNIHPVADVMIHPQYEGVNLTYDLAALKSESRLVDKGSLVVTLPSMLDYFLITIGERLTILGYGKFRNIDKDPLTRTVREVFIHSMPLSQCPTGPGTWSTRHLTGGTPVAHGACGTLPVCAGVLRSRTSPCNYCSGTPLLHQDVLLGIMSDNQHCGLSCEPALFVNLALVTDWLRSVLDSN